MKVQIKMVLLLITGSLLNNAFAQDAIKSTVQKHGKNHIGTNFNSNPPRFKFDSIRVMCLSGFKTIENSQFRSESLIGRSGSSIKSTMPVAKLEVNSRMPIAKLDSIYPYRYNMPIARVKVVKK